MSIASEFESTIENVQNAYQGLANLGATIPQNKTIENISDCLDEVYDVLPKTSFQEGTEVTIENGLKGKIDFDDGKVGFGQASQESTQGYNLADVNNYTNTQTDTRTAAQIFAYIGNENEPTHKSIIWADNLTSTGIKTYTFSVSDADNFTYTTIRIRHNGTIRDLIQDGIVTNIANGTYTFSIDYTGINVQAVGGFSFKDVMLNSGSTAQPYETYTGGYASPSPNWEQEVKCVAGVNILDDSKLTLFANNRYISTIDYLTKGQIPVNSKKTYSLVYLNNTLGDIGLFEYDSSNTKTTINATTLTNGTHRVKVFNLLSTTKTFGFYAGGDNSVDTISQFLSSKEIMLLEGDYSTQTIPPYLPYNTIEETIRGKNLFDAKTLLPTTQVKNGVTFTNNGDGTFNVSGTASANTQFVVSLTSILTKGHKYGLYSSKAYNNPAFNLTMTYGGDTVKYVIPNTGTFEFENKYSYTNLVLWIDSGTTISATNVKTMIYEGETQDNNYEPYVTPRTYQFSLGNNKFYNIGDYADELLYDVENDKVYKKAYIEEIHLTKNINWIGQVFNNVYRVNTDAYTDILLPLSESTSSYVKSNMYIAGWATVFGGLQSGYIGIYTNSNIYICTHFTTSNMQGWKDFLDANDVVVVAPRKEPLLTELTDTTLKQQVKNWYYSQSYNGTTILESNGELPMIIKVRALKGES